MFGVANCTNFNESYPRPHPLYWPFGAWSRLDKDCNRSLIVPPLLSIQAVTRTQDKARRYVSTFTEKCSRCREDIRRCEQELLEGQRAADKAVEDASRNCSRIVTKRSPRAIEIDIRKTKDAIQAEQGR